jgi:Uncharacterized protein conserved in bacteria
MTIYEKNMEALKKYKEDLFDCIEKLDHEKKDNSLEQIISIETRDGNKALVITKDGESIRLNSAYKPSAEAMKWAEQFELNNIDTVISMFGFGNGFFPREMMHKLTKENFLLIYEPSIDIFLHVLENYDITDLIEGKRVSITIEGVNDNEFKSVINYLVTWVNMNSQLVCKHPQYKMLFEKSHIKFLDLIRDNNEVCQINKNTERILSKSIISNLLNNLKYIKEGNIVSDFEGDFGEAPAIIVSAGPSLNKNVQNLKEAKGKAVIFCTDTAMKYVLAHNIIPDFIVTLDPNKSMGHFFADERCFDIPMLCLAEARHENLKYHRSRKIFYSLDSFLTQFYIKNGKKVKNLNSGGSVATGAFSVCVALGFKEIILIGQDLAYDGKFTHAGERSDHGGKLASDARLIEDVNGNMIYTRGDWYLYLNWFEQAIESIKNIEVVDATEGGAKIKGTKIMTLKEAITAYCEGEIDCENIVKKKPTTLLEEEYPKLKKYLSESIKDLMDIKNQAIENKRYCEKLIIEARNKNIDSERCQNWVKRLSKNNSKIEKKPVYNLVDIYIAEVSTNELDDVYVLTEDEVQNQISTYEKGSKIYQSMADSCDELEKMIRKEMDEL